MNGAGMASAGPRLELLQRRMSVVTIALLNAYRGALGDDLAVLVADLSCRVGCAFVRAVHTRHAWFDPEGTMKATPSQRAVTVAVFRADELAEIAAQIPLAEIATGLRRPRIPLHARILVVAEGGAEIACVHLRFEGSHDGLS